MLESAIVYGSHLACDKTGRTLTTRATLRTAGPTPARARKGDQAGVLAPRLRSPLRHHLPILALHPNRAPAPMTSVAQHSSVPLRSSPMSCLPTTSPSPPRAPCTPGGPCTARATSHPARASLQSQVTTMPRCKVPRPCDSTGIGNVRKVLHNRLRCNAAIAPAQLGASKGLEPAGVLGG
jgi:hypothetical protein